MGSPLERIEQAWRTREVGHGEHLDAAEVARKVGSAAPTSVAQTLAALRGGELATQSGSPNCRRL